MTKNKEIVKPFLKWAGGKEKELPHIIPNLPEFKRYFEPFVGGGAVMLAMSQFETDKLHINDKSNELISLYIMIKNQDKEFLNKIKEIHNCWITLEEIIEKSKEELEKLYIDYREELLTEEEIKEKIDIYIKNNKKQFANLIENFKNHKSENAEEIFFKEIRKNVKNKYKRTKKLELEKGLLPEEDIFKNIETGFKSGLYMYFRYLHNNIEKMEINHSFATALFYYIREYCYSSMFRYNSNGEFNVPYGGLSYNRKDFKKKINYLKDKKLIEHLSKTQIHNKDFEEFLSLEKPTEEDFIFLDPPYDSDFSTYANNTFDKEEQERLANYLISECDGKFMMVIKNTDYIFNLYNEKTDHLGRKIEITAFDKKYLVSFRNRNNRDCEHLIITNYKIPEIK